MQHLSTVQRRTIMKKLRRFLFRISAETCLKMNYFASKTPQIADRWGSAPDPCLNSMTRECTNALLLLNIFGWCRCLAILGQNETYILCFLALPSPSTKNVPAPLKELIFIDATNYINSAFTKFGILLATLCASLLMLSLPNQNFQSILFTYPFQS